MSTDVKTNPTVFIVDDDPAVQRAVGIVARSLGYPVQTFAGAAEFLHAYDESQPGCLVLDVRMPDMTGLDLQRMLKSAGVRIPAIMISGHADVRMAVDAMSLGAFTFLEKPFRMNELSESIGEAIARDELDRIKQQQRTELRSRLDSLTVKEREVLSLLLEGRTNKEMARALGISLRGVEDRRARLMKRMSAESVVELVAMVKSVGG